MNLEFCFMESNTTHIDQLLPVMEDFYTLQGEGYHQGRAAYFIRLGGCDVGCVWCDVKDSWDGTKFEKHEVNILKGKVQQTPAEIVVITGGEPLMHNLDTLTHILQNAGFKTHIETSGQSGLDAADDRQAGKVSRFRPAGSAGAGRCRPGSRHGRQRSGSGC